MKKHLLFTISLLLSLAQTGLSQDYSFPADNYRSTSNPYYWQNRPPYKGYWQQDVHYIILASLNDSSDIIDGSATLIYWNNSPDTLKTAFFHLYSNAQNKHSYYTSAYVNSGYKLKFGKYESKDLGCNVTDISSDNVSLRTELDNTVMKVWLSKPLAPGHSTTFHIKFKTYFDNGGTVRNRMKMFIAWASKNKDTVYKQYDVVHWYPRICVYDKKFGWDVEQHLAHEFYGDFGTYDVAFTLPNNYIVGATGTLINEQEMLPDSLFKKIDIRNFRNKTNESASPTVVVKRTNIPKTWLYHAENVHDFALTADPTYRIGIAVWKGVKCYSYAEEMHAHRWQDAAGFTAAVIATDSKFFGMYGYPSMIVADARDGMEYPMITLDGGGYPDYLGTLAHEISHNWFFGMLGSNETYRAVLDEGFTEFAESWDYNQICGPYEIQGTPINAWTRKYYRQDLFRYDWVYSGYLYNYIWGQPEFTENMRGKQVSARSNNYGFRDITLNTQSDDFHSMLNHDGGYSQVYFKGATMLYNLQYVLGDSLFFAAMQHYFNEWKFCHPYLDDFRNAITEYTHTDLTWFFDEWLNTPKTLDYGIQSIKHDTGKDGYIIRFARKGEMQMPIDFAVTSGRDSVYNFYIPNGWFVKKTTATVLPRWIGWGKVQPTYDAHVTIPGGINKVQIDTSNRLGDINMLNNTYPFPIKYYFDSKVYNSPDWTNYEAFVGPSVWYNGVDGAQLGIHVNGDYMLFMHNISATFYLNTGILQNDKGVYGHQLAAGKISYQTATEKFIHNSSINFYAQSLDGLDEGRLRLQLKDNSNKYIFYAEGQVMYRPHAWDTNYLLYPKLWQPYKYNNTIKIGIKHDYHYSASGRGNVDFNLRSAAFTQNYNYSQTTLTVINTQQIGKKLVLKARLFGQYGTGGIPVESALYAAGANPEELMNSPFTSAQGIIPSQWTTYGADVNHFQEGGGLDLRGYAGYLLPPFNARSTANGNYEYAYLGSTGIAVNGELEFNKFIHFNPKFLKNSLALTTYLFGDAGFMNAQQIVIPINENPGLVFSNLHADAGIGAALTIQKWGPLQLVKPLTIRFDMPLVLNQLPAAENNYVQMRWVIGIGRAF